MSQDDTYITITELRKIEKEIIQLRNKLHEDLMPSIRNSNESKDFKYEFTEGISRIQELQDKILNEIIIPDHDGLKAKHEIIKVGSIVKVQSLGYEKVNTYTIVENNGASPSEGRISNESPLGRALIGHSEGERIEFQTPSGTQLVQIVLVN